MTCRTNEIRIRIALVSRPGVVLKQIIVHGAVLGLLGLVAGCGGALLLTRLMSGLLIATSVDDPVTFVGVTLVLLMVAIVASLVPALRATRIDPVSALRFE